MSLNVHADIELTPATAKAPTPSWWFSTKEAAPITEAASSKSIY